MAQVNLTRFQLASEETFSLFRMPLDFSYDTRESGAIGRNRHELYLGISRCV